MRARVTPELVELLECHLQHPKCLLWSDWSCSGSEQRERRRESGLKLGKYDGCFSPDPIDGHPPAVASWVARRTYPKQCPSLCDSRGSQLVRTTIASNHQGIDKITHPALILEHNQRSFMVDKTLERSDHRKTDTKEFPPDHAWNWVVVQEIARQMRRSWYI